MAFERWRQLVLNGALGEVSDWECCGGTFEICTWRCNYTAALTHSLLNTLLQHFTSTLRHLDSFLSKFHATYISSRVRLVR